jgi:hypothetical protein
MATVAMMVLAGLVIILPQGSEAARSKTIIANPEPMLFSPDKYSWAKTSAYFDAILEGSSAGEKTQAMDLGDALGTVKSYYISNDYTGDYEPTNMTLRGEGLHCEVWVQENSSYPWGDPRNALTSQYTLSDEQVDYIIEQFDEVIYPTETAFFSEAPVLNGSDELVTYYFGDTDTFPTDDGHKTMIMVSNIRDENYYDPGYGIYIAGYFSPTVSMLYDRNIINIDTRDWTNRTGEFAARPFLYEGTVAHEYQHLLHDYIDPSEETWVNEGCSDYSEYLCGYGKAMAGHISAFLTDPSNSLTLWGDQGDDNILADYGAAALFMMYLNDQFGGSTIIQDLFNNNLTGTESVTDTLGSNGYSGWNFEKAFRAWRLANLIHDRQPGNGLYDYTSIDLDDYAPLNVLNYYQGGMVQRSDYFEGDTATSTVGAYGTDYIYVPQNKMRVKERLSSKFMFSGDDLDTSRGWTRDGGYWWSGAENEADLQLRAKLDLTQGGPDHSLTIYTWYNIEQDWDYGMVQVSTDGETWNSIPVEGLTVTGDEAVAANPDIYPSIPDQLPGFTGSSGGWTWLTFDLSEYNGKNVWVQFRYMTDWGTTEEGWYISDILVDGNLIDYYEFEPVYPEVSWIVTLVMYRNDRPAKVIDLKVSGYNEAMYRVWQLSTLKAACILVSPTGGSVDYEFGIVGGLAPAKV